MSMFIEDLENIVHKRFESKERLEKYLRSYFITAKRVKLCDFEGEIDFKEDNHIVGVIGNYDIDIWYLTDNENQLYITEVCWEENLMDEDVEFYDELKQILDIYTDNEWKDEPLDGDEVDNLMKILRNQLNFINGNITTKEYFENNE